jgi:hypothetical protein
VLVALGLSLLAAFGIRFMLERLPRRASAVAVLAFALVIAEGAAIPRTLGPAPRAPAVYASLVDRPPGILMLPAGRERDADHMLRASAHWRPLANGVAGYTPAGYRDLLAILERPPDVALVEELRERRIRTVVAHLDEMGSRGSAFDLAFAAQDGVSVIVREGSIAVYDVAA